MTTPPWCREKVMVYYYYSCCSYSGVFGKTLVHEFPISYSHTEWYLLFSRNDMIEMVACQKLTIIIIYFFTKRDCHCLGLRNSCQKQTIIIIEEPRAGLQHVVISCSFYLSSLLFYARLSFCCILLFLFSCASVWDNNCARVTHLLEL